MTEEYMNGMENEEVESDNSHTERYLTFMSDGLTYAIDTNCLTEIITNYPITELPMVPGYIAGIINLRGAIVPIVDIRARMGRSPADITGGSCIIVLDYDMVNLGIIIDEVCQVVDIDQTQISPMPVNNRQDLVSGMITLNEDQTFLILDCNPLFNNQ